MRSSVLLPQPEGPDDDDELAVGDVGVDAVDHLVGLGALAVALDDVVDADRAHGCFLLFFGVHEALDEPLLHQHHHQAGGSMARMAVAMTTFHSLPHRRRRSCA
jgi:hypothetical protein